MLNRNNIILFFISVIYTIVFLIEFSHYCSVVNGIIMLESFLDFTILLVLFFSIFQTMFISGISTTTAKYHYIYIFYSHLVNVKIYIYNIFINTFIFFFYFLVKIYNLYQSYKICLKEEYLKTFYLYKFRKLNGSSVFKVCELNIFF